MPSRYFDTALPRMLAHRGLAVSAPENSMLAFAHAIAAGAQYLETDSHASADGVAMLVHDPDLMRIAARKVRVDQLNKNELGRIDLGAGQHVPTLAEALDAFPEARFNIDIKSPTAISPVVRAILDLKALDRVLLTSFDEKTRTRAIAQLPGVATSASARKFVPALLAAKSGATALVRKALRGVDAVQIPERALGLNTLTERTIGAFHDAGVEVHVWTVNEPTRMHEILRLGVDGIVTDRVDLAMAVARPTED